MAGNSPLWVRRSGVSFCVVGVIVIILITYTPIIWVMGSYDWACGYIKPLISRPMGRVSLS